MVPSKSVGSWGMMLSRVRKSFRPIKLMSTASIVILPPEASTSRKRASTRVDFPLPVLPTTPTELPPLMVTDMPFKTSGVFGLYLN